MHTLTLTSKAGRLSEELARRGVGSETRVQVVVELLEDAPFPLAAMAQAGGAFDFLRDEPDLYTDADTIERRS